MVDWTMQKISRTANEQLRVLAESQDKEMRFMIGDIIAVAYYRHKLKEAEDE